VVGRYEATTPVACSSTLYLRSGRKKSQETVNSAKFDKLMSQTAEEKQICQYLLGKLAGNEQRQIEEQLMTRDDLFQQLQVLEDELIDDYLHNTLSKSERENFEKTFLSSPERRQKLQFARALRSYVAAANEGIQREQSKSSLWQNWWAALRTPMPVLQYGFPLVLLAALVGGLRMSSTIQRLSTEVAQVRTERGSLQEREQQLQQQLEAQRQRNVELAQQLAPTSSQSQKLPEAPLSTLAQLVLTPGLVRDSSGSPKRLTVSPEIRQVELRLALGDYKYESYRVLLQDGEGSEIYARNKVRPERSGSNHFLVLTLGAKDLSRDDYSVKVSGVTKSGEFEPLPSYTFRVR
jgi:hypothetical protein